MSFGKPLLLQQLTMYLIYLLPSRPAPPLISFARVKQIVWFSYRETGCGVW